MRDRFFESTGEFGEADDHHTVQSGKEDQVGDIEDSADGDKSRKPMRLKGDESRDTTSSHGQCVPGPCEMFNARAERHPRLVRVFLVGIMGFCVNFGLLLAHVDGVTRRLRRCRLHRAFRNVALLALRVDRIAVSIARS